MSAQEARRHLLEAAGLTEEQIGEDEALRLKLDFMVSATTTESPVRSLDQVHAWLAEHRANRENVVDLIPIEELERWYVEEGTGNIRHDSGKFFSIEGVRVEGQEGSGGWSQPVINQPEVGILGIIVKRIDGIYHFLMQAKTEPGNINDYQVSPTVQATHSNYTKVHGGRLPAFVGLFLDPESGPCRVIFDGLQSEEGARFWQKSNRNMILEVDEGVLGEIPPEFCWMTLYQLKRLLLEPDTVNICARSVLSCLP